MLKIAIFVVLLADVLCVHNNVSAGTAGADDMINAYAINGLEHLLNAVKGMSAQLSAISGLEGVPKQLVTGFAANLTRVESDLSQRSGNITNLASKAYGDVGVLIDYSLVTENELNRELLLQSSALSATNAHPSGQNPLTVALQLVAQTRQQLVDSLKRIHNSLETRANTDERFKPVAQEFADMFKTIYRQTAKTQQSGRQEVVDQLSKVEEWIGKATGDQAKEAQHIRSQLRRRLADIDRQIVSAGHEVNGAANAKPPTGLLDMSADLLSAVKAIVMDASRQLSAIVGLEGMPVCAQIMKEFAVRLTGLENGLSNTAPGQMTPDQSRAVYDAIGVMIEFALSTENQLNRELLSRTDILAEYGTQAVQTAQDAAINARQVVVRTRKQLVDSFKRMLDSLKLRANSDERIEPVVQVFANVMQTVDKKTLETLQSVRKLVVDELTKLEDWILRGTADGDKRLEQYRRQLRQKLIRRLESINAEMM